MGDLTAAGGAIEQARLAPTVHAVRAGRDLVLLDLDADDYLLIPECGDVRIRGDDIRGPMPLLLDLAANELLLSGTSGARRRPPPELPRKALPEAPPWTPSVRDLATFALIWTRAAARRPTLQAVSRRVACRTGRRDDLDAVSARVAGFLRLLPFAPTVGACLFQAELLLRFLNAAGLDADWVFGVRTYPFMAHCWLQIDDHCVGQAPETLAMYRPLLVL